ncbi:MAG TPA: DUF4242 domain-containing protein [Dehalococcoidia bacterium]|nr:DUF4242 domain-containing protein [Dehalococcoidia bacterium]
MALYLIRRSLGRATQEDLDGASIRALSCLYNYDGLRWLTSYWNEPSGQIYCIYEAQNEQQILEHSAQARLPCDEITLVQQVIPEEYAPQIATRVNA